MGKLTLKKFVDKYFVGWIVGMVLRYKIFVKLKKKLEKY